MALYDSSLRALMNQLDMQPGSDSYDRQLILKAFNRCVIAHSDQRRASGEPYYMHPIAVAEIIISLGMDSESIAAALFLHDVIEDTEYGYDYVKSEFGKALPILWTASQSSVRYRLSREKVHRRKISVKCLSQCRTI